MGQDDADLSFTALIDQAQKANKPSDLSSPFNMPLPDGHRFIDTSKDILNRSQTIADWEVKVKVEFFSIPHDNAAYEETLNQIHSDETQVGGRLIRYEERTFSKDGDFLVVICYLKVTGKRTRNPNPLGLPQHPEEDED